jgi:hypothetical protein
MILVRYQGEKTNKKCKVFQKMEQNACHSRHFIILFFQNVQCEKNVLGKVPSDYNGKIGLGL